MLRLQIPAQRVRQQVGGTAKWIGEGVAFPGEQHETLGLAYRQHAEKRLIDQRKDSGIGADSEGEREHGGRCKAGAALQRAQAVAHVARDVLEPGQASLVANRIHRLRAASGLNPRDPHRFVRIASATSRRFRRELNVQAQLLLEVGIRVGLGAVSPTGDASIREERAAGSTLSPFIVEQGVNDARHLVPRLFFFDQLAPAGCCECVVPGFAVRFGDAPVGTDEAALFQPHQRGIQRAHIQLERAAGHLLEARGDGVSVQRAE